MDDGEQKDKNKEVRDTMKRNQQTITIKARYTKGIQMKNNEAPHFNQKETPQKH